ncbi:MAG TPA: prolipoprotein diacylglyceryl transferase [Desulfobacterales bacterium]|nr:prolipoprotein diacylglyceryl transferase [Desulfobacterales bacterium]
MTDFWTWWQHLPQHISPVIFQIGSFKLQYYGLMYLVAFGITYGLVLYRLRHESRFTVSREQVNDLTTVIILGLMVGARLGYVVFYNLGYFLQHPLEIFLPFEFSDGITFTGISGMSYHGGVIGIIFAAWIYTRKNGLALRDMADLYVPCIPLGYTFGRIGNFINGELYGRATTAPIGMLFPLAPDKLLRHPSQLYEALFEGIFLFAVMWSIRRLRAPRGAMLGFYLIGYGLVRFFIEFYREPDAHIGFVVSVFSMGQLLCAAMIAAGLVLVLGLKQRADA